MFEDGSCDPGIEEESKSHIEVISLFEPRRINIGQRQRLQPICRIMPVKSNQTPSNSVFLLLLLFLIKHLGNAKKVAKKASKTKALEPMLCPV